MSREGQRGSMRKTRVEYSLFNEFTYSGIITITILLHTHLIDKADAEKYDDSLKTIEHQIQFLAWNRRGHIQRKKKH